MSKSLTSAFIGALLSTAFALADDRAWPDEAHTPRAESARIAVLEWCDAQGATFMLPKGRPMCNVPAIGRRMPNMYMGVWETDKVFVAQFWWKMRSFEKYRVGILWLADHLNPHPVAEAFLQERYEEIHEPHYLAAECVFAAEAMGNSAKVPVRLVGPTADECLASLMRSGDVSP